ncbi:transposase family protein, partial [Streptococcus equi]
MEQSHVITQLLGIKDPHITFSKEIHDMKTHKELKAVLDYDAPPCPNCQSQMGKYDFQRESKVPFLDCAGYKTLIRLKKRRFKCQFCGKITVAETSLVPKNHQIPTI